MHTTSDNGALSRAQIIEHLSQTLANLAVGGVVLNLLASSQVALG